MSDIEINMKALVKRFGGRAALWRKLGAVGFHLSPRSIDNWCDRGCLPMRRLALLVDLARLEGWDLSINEYIPVFLKAKETNKTTQKKATK